MFRRVTMAPVLNLPAGFGIATLRWTGAALPTGAVSTFGFSDNGAVTEPGAIAANVGTTFWLSGNGWPSTMTLVDVEVKMGPLETGPVAVAPIGIAGGAAPEAYSPNAALLVTKRTLSGGRRGKGRMFLPPLGENAVTTGGVIDPVQVTTIQGRLNDFMAAQGVDELPLFLIHRHDPELNQSPVAPTQINQLLLDSKLASQRRRLRR